MNKARTILITGCNGGIGASLVDAFADEGWRVIGVDRAAATGKSGAAHILNADISDFCSSDDKLAAFRDEVHAAADGAKLSALINNAAVQTLAGVGALTSADFNATMAINVIAPFLLVKAFLPDLKETKGSVINIGSVHAQATKPQFAAYATSKSALHGLTRALAVDLGPDVRVNTLAPAATATTMLKAGFEGNAAAFKELEHVHPLKRIAEPDEIAKIALFLASHEASFLTGATIYADGGILSRLHDPA